MVQALMHRACAGLKDVRYGRAWLQASLLFSLTWTVGGALDGDSRVKFDTFIRSLLTGLDDVISQTNSLVEICRICTGKNDAYPFPSNIGRWECHLPADGTLYDYVYEYKQRGQWRQWAESIRNIPLPETGSLKDLIVPTVETARYSYILELSLAIKSPLLLVGCTGTGKTMCIREKMMTLSEDEFVNLSMTFTAQTTSGQVQDVVLGRLDKRRKGIFGPSAGKRCLIFVDDLNMPAKEQYGAQPPIELLRQYLDYNLWYENSLSLAIAMMLTDAESIGTTAGTLHL